MGKRQSWSWLMPIEIYREVKEFAEARNMPMSVWMANAARSQLRRERKWREGNEEKREKLSKTFPSGWPKSEPCPYCGRYHDVKKDHNITDQSFEVMLMMLENDDG